MYHETWLIEESQTAFTTLITEVLVLAYKADNHEADNSTLKAFICQCSKDADCQVAFHSVGYPNSSLNVAAEGY